VDEIVRSTLREEPSSEWKRPRVAPMRLTRKEIKSDAVLAYPLAKSDGEGVQSICIGRRYVDVYTATNKGAGQFGNNLAGSSVNRSK
jgi:hypothetical protein